MNKKLVKCACGCGGEFEYKFTNGVVKRFLPGHNSKVDSKIIRENLKVYEIEKRAKLLKAKEKSFKKIYENAPYIECACGCKQLIKSKDRYGRDKKFVNGHNNRKYDDPKQYLREYRKRHQKRLTSNKTKRHRKEKAKLLSYKGGKCLNCGLEYNGKNACLFDLHHRVPSEKEFVVNASAFNKYSLKKIYEEAEKCDILCSNCHRILHNKEY